MPPYRARRASIFDVVIIYLLVLNLIPVHNRVCHGTNKDAGFGVDALVTHQYGKHQESDRQHSTPYSVHFMV